MPHDNKFSNKLHKMQEIFTDDLSSNTIKNNMVDIFANFMTPSITSRIDNHKVKGYSGSSLFSMLVFLPYLSVLSIWDLVSGELVKILEAGKDAYYNFKEILILIGGVIYIFLLNDICIYQIKNVKQLKV